MEHIVTAAENLQDFEDPQSQIEHNVLTSSSEMCSRLGCPSHSRSSGVLCGVASGESQQWRRRRMSDGIFVGTTSNVRCTAQSQSWNRDRTWKCMSVYLACHWTSHWVAIRGTHSRFNCCYERTIRVRLRSFVEQFRCDRERVQDHDIHIQKSDVHYIT